MNAYTIRITQPDDAPAILRLAALDSGRPPRGSTFVAELDGRIIAAMSASGGVIADPFVPTAGAVELLALRLRQLDQPRRFGRARARRFGFAPRSGAVRSA